MLIDSHSHLQDERIIESLPGLLERATEAGIMKIISCGSNPEDNPELLVLSRRYPIIQPSFGIHPWYVHQRCHGWKENLIQILEDNPKAGVGEIGLDGVIEESEMKEQIDVFSEQLSIAKEYSRPASIHCRRLWEPMLDILKRNTPLPRGFVIHSYSGSAELVEPLARLGAYFSFSASITYPKNRRGIESARIVPEDRLLIETDSPDISPYINGKQAGLNEPANLIHVCKRIAEIRVATESEIAKLTFDNACRLFGINSGI